MITYIFRGTWHGMTGGPPGIADARMVIVAACRHDLEAAGFVVADVVRADLGPGTGVCLAGRA